MCDPVAASDDLWEVTIGVYAPLALVGKGGTATANTGDCSAAVTVCRVPPSLGVMKALVSINHPGGDGDSTYDLIATCLDKNSQALPNGATILDLKTDNP